MKKSIKKLTLNKITISNLDKSEMSTKIGGTLRIGCNATSKLVNYDKFAFTVANKQWERSQNLF